MNSKKPVTKRKKLGNAYLNKRTEATKVVQNCQQNVCASLLRKQKMFQLENLNIKLVSVNKKFWKKRCTLFPKKIYGKNHVYLKRLNLPRIL